MNAAPPPPPAPAPPTSPPTAPAPRLRLAFMGSPAFAVPALEALAAAHDVVVAYAQPPKPAHRGQRETPCPVHRAARALGIEVRTPRRLRANRAEADYFAALGLDAAVVAAYGLILPAAFLDAPRRGCLNIHASLLPRWRGAAPIQAAILAGDAHSGITIMQMDAGLDTGPMLLAQTLALAPDETAATLHDRLAAIGPGLILRALAEAPAATLQDDAAATYAPKLSRADSPLDFAAPAAALARRVRALTPWPGTTARLGDQVLKILAAQAEPAPEPEPAPGTAPPGTALDDALLVACGEGALRLTRLQRPGRAPLDGADFLRGQPIPKGTLFS